MDKNPILDIRGLTVDFNLYGRTVRALNNFSLSLARGETMAVVGESGSGKTVHALAVLGLLPMPPAQIISGEIMFEGRNLLNLPPAQMRNIRGNRISMIFQDPMTSLNPVFTIGYQVAEALLAHGRAKNRAEAHAKTLELLQDAGIDEPARRAEQYPHQFSGGMRQRAMIACALACSPDIIIADEPTTALDVTIQAQILELINSLKRKYQTSVILITHNLGIVAQTADRVTVLYSGRVMERASVQELFAKPKHPYTRGLLDSIPSIHGNPDRLSAIKGIPPAPGSKTAGCVFAPRCPNVFAKCLTYTPPEFPEGGGTSACFLCEGAPA